MINETKLSLPIGLRLLTFLISKFDVPRFKLPQRHGDKDRGFKLSDKDFLFNQKIRKKNYMKIM